MKKSILAASAGSIALAGLAWAAASSTGLVKGGPGAILLPASDTTVASAPIVAATPAAAADGFQLAADGRHIVDAYICVFRAGAVARGSERAEANRSANAAGGRVGHVYGHALQGFSVNVSARGVEMMQRSNPRIDYCEQDQVATIVDPIDALAQPGGVDASSTQETPYGITRVKGGLSGVGKVAWVIDTGIDLDHPDLSVDTARSVSYVSREKSADDLNGHGSHVAGTIAALNNTFGVIGVAAGASVVAVKVLDRRGSGSYSGVIAGVDYVAAKGAAGDVANMSLGGGTSDSLDTAVKNAAAKGIRFAIAAGNDGADASNYSPARVNGTNIYTVSAINSSDTFASFSNFGNPPVDYAEPGVSIKSTWKGGAYNTISGTSMAAPHLAGVLLLGSVVNGGTAKNDPDGNPDVIGVH